MVTQEEIKKIAMLSRLYVADEELDALARDMSDIVAFADQIASVEVEAAPLEDGVGLDALRGDVSEPSPDRAEMLSNAKTSDGEYFVLEVRKRG
ncbi:MAG: aspartyl/glutamyl-tRNA amidotransferase subunit C [Oscillospiraceae bacterium]|jgi:aspartyl-tRNA(Asn)/glutamyl-tRNA(Gln) amidotransferase subunit C|nr:aspartyl/glutamyl-tRNA amidotransferase subunit C [Oscillospiraceae bacterium]